MAKLISMPRPTINQLEKTKIAKSLGINEIFTHSWESKKDNFFLFKVKNLDNFFLTWTQRTFYSKEEFANSTKYETSPLYIIS
jgi:hypothetical protein